jgi:hypothetical protein
MNRVCCKVRYFLQLPRSRAWGENRRGLLDHWARKFPHQIAEIRREIDRKWAR